MAKQIRAVLFAAAGTLIYPQPAIEDTYFEIGQHVGSRLAPAAPS